MVEEDMVPETPPEDFEPASGTRRSSSRGGKGRSAMDNAPEEGQRHSSEMPSFKAKGNLAPLEHASVLLGSNYRKLTLICHPHFQVELHMMTSNSIKQMKMIVKRLVPAASALQARQRKAPLQTRKCKRRLLLVRAAENSRMLGRIPRAQRRHQDKPQVRLLN